MTAPPTTNQLPAERLVEQRTPYDCLTACLATVFGCPYEDAPIFGNQETGEHEPGWHQKLDDWLAARGFAWLQRVREDGMTDDPARSPWAFPGLWIAGVASPRINGEHAVVMRWNELVWDPHPQREMGHGGFESADYFLPIDPGALRLAAVIVVSSTNQQKRVVAQFES